jgi:hypothetical protein
MPPTNATLCQRADQPAPRRLTLAKETLRRLTPTELRLTAGGAAPLRASGTCRPSDYCRALAG